MPEFCLYSQLTNHHFNGILCLRCDYMKYIECSDSFKDIRKFDVGFLLQQIDRLNACSSSIIPENFINRKHEKYSLKHYATKFDHDRLDSLTSTLFVDIEPDFVPPEPESVLRFYEEFYKKYGDVYDEELEPD